MTLGWESQTLDSISVIPAWEKKNQKKELTSTAPLSGNVRMSYSCILDRILQYPAAMTLQSLVIFSVLEHIGVYIEPSSPGSRKKDVIPLLPH